MLRKQLGSWGYLRLKIMTTDILGVSVVDVWDNRVLLVQTPKFPPYCWWHPLLSLFNRNYCWLSPYFFPVFLGSGGIAADSGAFRRGPRNFVGGSAGWWQRCCTTGCGAIWYFFLFGQARGFRNPSKKWFITVGRFWKYFYVFLQVAIF